MATKYAKEAVSYTTYSLTNIQTFQGLQGQPVFEPVKAVSNCEG